MRNSNLPGLPGSPLTHPFPDVASVLSSYKKGTAVIRFELDGKTTDWAVSVSPTDSVHTLQEHLQRWLPGAKFIEAALR